MSAFFRFPHTPHLAWMGGGIPRDDKVLSAVEADALLAGQVVVEEKLDGANLGFSVSPDGVLRAQNRGHYLDAPHAGQFARLGQWLAPREEALFDALGEHLVAFGEWCAARHSLAYAALPDWWLLFDVYDRRAGRFWSTERRDRWAGGLGLITVPSLLPCRYSLQELRQLVINGRSAFRDGPLEGVVIRCEDDSWLQSRAKLVRADFTQQIAEHWRHRSLQWNRLDDFAIHG